MPVVDPIGRRTRHHLVTASAKSALLAAGATNLEFTSLEEAEVPAFVYTVGAKHLLPDDFAERVLKAYETAGLVPPSTFEN